MAEILIADDDAAIRTVVSQALSRQGHDVRVTSNAATLWRWAQAGDGDVIVTDVIMPDENAFDLLPRIKRVRPDLPIIVMSAQNTFMTAITAAEKGAFDYLPKPFDLKELVATVDRALSQAGRKAPTNAKGDLPDMPLVGRSPAMQEIYRVIARMTQSDLTVMINGESGTGKELVARALHDFGKRKNGPFVAVNMAAIPRELIESELFGHERGAFTGATSRSAGRFELANGGTLFLDEIGDMPMEAQTRLLRVLQEGEYTTVGGRTPISTNARIVAATHQNLAGRIEQGQFREDLYYRLNVVPLRLPPLRERGQDIPDLVRHFLQDLTAKGLEQKTLTGDAMARLKSYAWPGNVRELENLILRIAALYPQYEITLDLVEAELEANGSSNATSPTGREKHRSLAETVDLFVQTILTERDETDQIDNMHAVVLREIEQPLISAVLHHTNGNQIKAAAMLGLNRNTLRKKISELGITVVRSHGPENK